MGGKWRLEGWDTFEGASYSLAGEYATRALAVAAARKRLGGLERTQPSTSSGGQGLGGIQDRVFIIHPDGQRERA